MRTCGEEYERKYHKFDNNERDYDNASDDSVWSPCPWTRDMD